MSRRASAVSGDHQSDHDQYCRTGHCRPNRAGLEAAAAQPVVAMTRAALHGPPQIVGAVRCVRLPRQALPGLQPAETATSHRLWAFMNCGMAHALNAARAARQARATCIRSHPQSTAQCPMAASTFERRSRGATVPQYRTRAVAIRRHGRGTHNSCPLVFHLSSRVHTFLARAALLGRARRGCESNCNDSCKSP